MSDIFAALLPVVRDINPDGNARSSVDVSGSGFGDIFEEMRGAGKEPAERQQGSVAAIAPEVSKPSGHPLNQWNVFARALGGNLPSPAGRSEAEAQGCDSDAVTASAEPEAGRRGVEGDGGLETALPAGAGADLLLRELRVGSQPQKAPVQAAGNDRAPGVRENHIGLEDQEPVGTQALAVRVTRSETHFKPVIGGFFTKYGPVAVDPETRPNPVAADTPVVAPAVRLRPQATGGQPDPVFLTAGAGPSDQAISPPKGPGSMLAVGNDGSVGDIVLARVSKAQGSTSALDDGVPNGPDAAGYPSPAVVVRNIASAVTTEAGSVPRPASAQPAFMELLPSTFAVSARASEAAVRHVSIQLHPADLGVVNVTLKLEGDVLELRMEVRNEEAAQMLGRERDSLCAHLRAAGYKPEVVAIQVGSFHGTADGQNSSGRSDHSQFTDGGGEGSPGNARGGEGQNEQHNRSREDRETVDVADGRRIDGGLYL